MQNLLYRWLLLIGLGHVVLGVVLAFTAQLPPADFYFQHLYASFAVTDAPAAYQQLLSTLVRLFGPTVASWGLLFSLLIHLYRQHGHSLIKPALFAALLLWCVLDSAISSYYGLFLHVYLNSAAALSIAIPLIFLKAIPHTSGVSTPLRYASQRPLRILLSGGTGFIGQALSSALSQAGHEVLILTRGNIPASSRLSGRIGYLSNLDQLADDERIDCIINLAGEPLAKGRWTPRRKAAFLASRLHMTNNLRHLVQRLQHKPEVLLNASAVGYYGHQHDKHLDEQAAPVDCFSHQLCREWEETAQAFELLGLRVCLLRIGIVLGRQGGPMQELRRSFDWGLATRLGNGNQWMSWIHLQDVLDICAYLLTNPELQGAINVTAPEPVTQAAFSSTLRRQLTCLPLTLPIPAWLLRMMVGEMADEILLSGQRVVPQKLLDSGYRFAYSDLPQALAELTHER